MYLVALLYSYFSLMKFPQFVADQKKTMNYKSSENHKYSVSRIFSIFPGSVAASHGLIILISSTML